LVLAQASDLLVLVEGLKVFQVRVQGQVEEWVFPLEKALRQVLELVEVLQRGQGQEQPQGVQEPSLGQPQEQVQAEELDFRDLSEEQWEAHLEKETQEFLELAAQVALKKQQQRQLQQQGEQPQPQQQPPAEPLTEQQLQHLSELAAEAERQHTEKQQWRLS
jgi:hypothetical protein